MVPIHVDKGPHCLIHFRRPASTLHCSVRQTQTQFLQRLMAKRARGGKNAKADVLRRALHQSQTRANIWTVCFKNAY